MPKGASSDPIHLAAQIVDELIAEIAASPMDVYGTSGGAAETEYLEIVGPTYARTLRDILSAFPESGAVIRILEIGAYQGIVSLALAKLGYAVEVFDIPDILQSQELRARYDRSGISYQAGDLIQGKLPYEDARFDCVIICEVIEHLNFNPLPTLTEINRVTKSGGCIYVGMPNQARLGHRVRALFGKSTHEPIAMFFRLQCDPAFRVGLHWREYTMTETRELFARLGYRPERSYYFADEDARWPSGIYGWIRYFSQLVMPSFKSSLVYLGRKETEAKVAWPTPPYR